MIPGKDGSDAPNLRRGHRRRRRPLFSAGLDLEAALGLIGEHRAAGRIQHAVSELDLAIRDIRDMVFDSGLLVLPLLPAGQARALRVPAQAVVLGLLARHRPRPGQWRGHPRRDSGTTRLSLPPPGAQSACRVPRRGTQRGPNTRRAGGSPSLSLMACWTWSSPGRESTVMTYSLRRKNMRIIDRKGPEISAACPTRTCSSASPGQGPPRARSGRRCPVSSSPSCDTVVQIAEATCPGGLSDRLRTSGVKAGTYVPLHPAPSCSS